MTGADEVLKQVRRDLRPIKQNLEDAKRLIEFGEKIGADVGAAKVEYAAAQEQYKQMRKAVKEDLEEYPQES